MATANDLLMVNLEARVTQFEKAFNRANSKATQTYKQITNGSTSMVGRVERDFRRSASNITGVATQLRGAIGLALGAVGAGAAINVIRNMEKLRASLETVTGSADNAAKAFDLITKFAATTPFSVEQVTQAFIKLKALGLDPSEAALTSYGNTAAAMGKSLDQMIEAVADAATGEFERLKEFGIRAASEGNKVTFTFRGVARTVGKNAAEIEAYLKSIGDVEFAGAMARQSKTLDGALSNLGDSTTALIDLIGQAGLGRAIADLAREMAGAAQDGAPLATFLGETLGSAVDELTDLFRGLNSTIFEFRKLADQGLFDYIAGDIRQNSPGLIDQFFPGLLPNGPNPFDQAMGAIRRPPSGMQSALQRAVEARNTPQETLGGGGPAEINIVADKLSGLEEKLESAVRQLVEDANAAGHAITVTSALRSTEKQRQLWNEALAKYGSPSEARKYVAPPGSSMHEKGSAVDIAFPDRAAREWVAKNMGAYGLKAPVPTETPLGNKHAHLELAGSRGGAKVRDEAAEAAKRQAEAYKGVTDELRFEGEQILRNTLAQEIASAQRQAGVEAASAEGQAIAGLVTKNYQLAEAQEAVKAAQEAATERAGEFAGIARSAVGGMISDLRNGVSAADALSNALDRVIDRLIDMALESAFTPQMFAGLLGGLGGGAGAPMSLIPRAGGGPVNRGSAYLVGEKRPEVFVPDSNGVIIPSVRAVAASGGGGGGGGRSGGGEVSVVVNNSTGQPAETRERRTNLGREIEIMVGTAIGKGKFDKPMGARYGSSPMKTRRA